MPAQNHWAACRLELQATVDGVEYEVSQYSGSFEINSIPRCQINVAVGRDMKSFKAAAAHSKIGQLVPGSQLLVYLKVTPLGKAGDAPNDWPPTSFLIFRGHVTGTGWQRATGSAAFTIQAEHWLADLNYSSAISGASHPGNPSDFTYPAFFRSPDAEDGGGNTAQWLPHARIVGGIQRQDLEADLWDRVLRPLMRAVCRQDTIDPELATGEANATALAALDQIRSEAMGMRFDGGINGESISNAVAWDLEHSLGRSDVHTTLWAKLVGDWASNYWFALIPRVDDAVIVPFTGGLRGAPWATIGTGDYVSCDLSSPMPQLLRCVGISLPTSYSAAGDTGPAPWGAKRQGLAAIYRNQRPAGKDKGMVLIKDAPRWLADPVQGYKYGKITSGTVPPEPVRTGLTGKDTGPPAPTDGDPKKNQDDMRVILKQYAQQWFVIEMLKGRTGELSGRLRFDISPGAQVKVIGGTDPFLEQDQLSASLFGVVSKVTYLINAEAQRAGTSFTLAHIRNQAENESDDTSIGEPPLYKAGWRGATLSDEV